MFRNLLNHWTNAVRAESSNALKNCYLDDFMLCIRERHDPVDLFNRVLRDIEISHKSGAAPDLEHLVHWFTMNASFVVIKDDTYLREVTMAAQRAANLLPSDKQENFRTYVLNPICGTLEKTRLSLRVFAERLVNVLHHAGHHDYEDEDYSLRRNGRDGAFLLVLKKETEHGKPLVYDGEVFRTLSVTPPLSPLSLSRS